MDGGPEAQTQLSHSPPVRVSILFLMDGGPEGFWLCGLLHTRKRFNPFLDGWWARRAPRHRPRARVVAVSILFLMDGGPEA